MWTFTDPPYFPWFFSLLGGLGLLLFGVRLMAEGLQKTASQGLRRLLTFLTRNRVLAACLGAGVATLMQSSGITGVMVIGFVHAGLLNLIQALAIALGANIGTTITAQLIAFKLPVLALPLVALGAFLRLFAGSRRWRYSGEIVLGLGLLFLGLGIIKDGCEPLRQSVWLSELLGIADAHPLLAVFAGALLTVLVQSSSATVGMIMAFAAGGLLDFTTSVALILGENIGITVTANLAALRSSLTAKRAAVGLFLFNVIGVAYMLLFLPWFMQLVDGLTPGAADLVATTAAQAREYGVQVGERPFVVRHIANTHTLFNAINLIIFLPLLALLARLSRRLVPDRRSEAAVEDSLQPMYLDERVLDTPPLAIGQARAEVQRMSRLAADNLDTTMGYLAGQVRSNATLTALAEGETQLDMLQRRISDYLVAISQRSVSQASSQEIARLLHTVNELENIGDCCENLWQLKSRQLEGGYQFSAAAMAEFKEMTAEVAAFMQAVSAEICRNPGEPIHDAAERENRIDAYQEQLRNHHIGRLHTGQCQVVPGLLYNDMLHNLERIGDYCFSIARQLPV